MNHRETSFPENIFSLSDCLDVYLGACSALVLFIGNIQPLRLLRIFSLALKNSPKISEKGFFPIASVSLSKFL